MRVLSRSKFWCAARYETVSAVVGTNIGTFQIGAAMLDAREREEAGGRVTIVDVARSAGVSKSTVSLVLSGSELVAPKTRERVNRAMQALGYVYHRGAASLRAA